MGEEQGETGERGGVGGRGQWCVLPASVVYVPASANKLSVNQQDFAISELPIPG